ncbi:phosphatidate cytidylyltransferase [Thermocrinis sp.]|uniref:phosphatidate cytidylyltransferase n=1 Tax=Thermocrinis sp. TaxID=2024383 RepID=UPI002FDD4B25
MQFYKGRESVGILIGALTLLSAFFPDLLFLLFLLLLSFGIGRELSNALDAKKVSYFVPLVLLLSSYRLELGIFAVLAFGFLIAYLRWSLDSLLKSVLILTYAGLLPSFLLLVKSHNHWEFLKLVFFAYTVDTASYYAGKLFGKRPLAPRLSPKKTWEGLVGGALAGLLFFLIINKPVLFTIPFVLVALLGDLFKSFIKRQVGIKDFSQLLGEHGGLTDRFDSVLFICIFWTIVLI